MVITPDTFFMPMNLKNLPTLKLMLELLSRPQVLAPIASVLILSALYATIWGHNAQQRIVSDGELLHKGSLGRRLRLGLIDNNFFYTIYESTLYDFWGRQYLVRTIGGRVFVQTESLKPAIEQ